MITNLGFVNDWARALNLHHSVHCPFVDFTKAFASVPYERLLLKLLLFGVGGVLLNLFRCFLTTRRHCVVLNGSFSSRLPWVLQGTILGPLLFILYSSDLKQFVKCKFKLFADNFTLYHQIISEADCLCTSARESTCLPSMVPKVVNASTVT